jgi:hypothetical protein
MSVCRQQRVNTNRPLASAMTIPTSILTRQQAKADRRAGYYIVNDTVVHLPMLLLLLAELHLSTELLLDSSSCTCVINFIHLTRFA